MKINAFKNRASFFVTYGKRLQRAFIRSVLGIAVPFWFFIGYLLTRKSESPWPVIVGSVLALFTILGGAISTYVERMKEFDLLVKPKDSKYHKIATLLMAFLMPLYFVVWFGSVLAEFISYLVFGKDTEEENDA